MMDLLCLYLVNVLRPVFEDPKSSAAAGGGCSDGRASPPSRASSLSCAGQDYGESPPTNKMRPTTTSSTQEKKIGLQRGPGASGHSKRPFKDIELLDLSGPKLIHGLRSWFVLYQIIGQLNWMGKPLYVSMIYKAILIPTCVYVVWHDFLEPITSSLNIADQFKNPIFVFISLSAAVTMLLHAILTIYNNLFNLCPMFKVLTTERLCFVREEVQHIAGTNTMPSMLLFFSLNTLLFRMCVARNLADFIHNFDILQFLLDLFVLLCLGYHLIGVSYIDFYIRVCFGYWIIAMKTNLEYRFAYLQKHQQQQQEEQQQLTATSASAANHHRRMVAATTAASVCDTAELEVAADAQQRHQAEAGDDDDGQSITTIATASHRNTNTNTNANAKPTRLLSSSSSFSLRDHMTLADFRAKYKIDTLDEIQRNLNTMDDHLEVSREFQNSSLVLITLSAFLTNGALLLLAYNLLANQGNYFHGVVVVLVAASYTWTIFLCYIGDSWILYALESFVQTVEDEYFLQSGGEGESGTELDGAVAAKSPLVLSATRDQDAISTTTSAAATTTTTTIQRKSLLPGDWQAPQTHQKRSQTEASETGSEPAPTGQQAIQQSYQLFMIKKRDVLFCREFLHQFQNHLATPWSKLDVKIQLHMLGTFVTLIAAQIIFDREH